MGNVSYKPIIEDMTWSFSRVSAFDDCPYRWFLKYIKKYEDNDRFFSSYGSFMHKLIEQYYKGELNRQQMLVSFLKNFSTEVKGTRPRTVTPDKYINAGIEYINNFQPFPCKPVAVEKEIRFEIDKIPFVGFIDFLGEDENGDIYVIDNKSRNLKQRSGKKKPTVKDKELDEMLKQLYVYAEGVKQEYGRYPKYLCFNCFKNGVFIKEEFDEARMIETKEWIKQKITEIENEEDFVAYGDYFKCSYICGITERCERRCDK